MKVSIIIPVYNVAHYIKRCLDSVTNQNYTSIECILVDDCGSDNSMMIAEKYISTYQGPIKFVIIRHPNNKGLGVARNTGISVASGIYLYFLDSDDAITPDCIVTLVKLAEKYPDVDWVQGNTVEGTGYLRHIKFLNQVPEYCNNKTVLDQIILGPQSANTACGILIKQDFLIRNSLLFPSAILHEDMFWRYYLAKVTKAAAFTSYETYFYYNNENTITTSTSSIMLKRRYDAFIYSAEQFLADISKNDNTLKFQFLYFLTVLLDCTIVLNRFFSLKCWLDYWKRVVLMIPQMPVRPCWAKVVFSLSLLPPLCFLVKFDKIRWRIKHYVFEGLWNNFIITKEIK